MSVVIQVENLSKYYRLGLIGGGTLREDLNRWWAKARGRPDPLLKIGETDHGNRVGGELWALRDVSFQVREGEILGIIGRNGAGKSTLLKILSRITAPTSGQVKIKGRVGSLLEVGTGFHPELTGRENIYLNGAILGMKKAEIDRKLDEIIDFAEIEQFMDTPVKRYSSGMYVRLAFAVAAHLEPEILIVDEVLAVGDIGFQKKCLGKMGDVASKGKNVLFVSHNIEAISKLCTTGIQFTAGQISRQGHIKIVIDNYLSSLLTTTGDSSGYYLRDSNKKVSMIDISKVRLSQDGISKCIFDLNNPLTVDIQYNINSPIEGAYLAFQVRTMLGLPIFTSTNIDTARIDSDNIDDKSLLSSPHVGTARVSIPSQVLNVGEYEMHVSVFALGRGLIDLMTDIYFSVYDSGSFSSRPFNTARQGVVLQKLDWDVTVCNHLPGELGAFDCLPTKAV